MNVALADTASSGELSGGVRDERHEESILDDTVEPAARTDLDSDPAVAARAAIKRRPGRPKGSLDKNKTPKPGTDEQPKTRGRPRGTGPRQLEKARAASMGAIPAAFPAPLESEPKRPVGRPRKMPPPRAFSVYMGQRIVRGMPAVIRTRAAAEPNENNPNNLHPMFLPPGREHETASTPAVTANPPQLHSQPVSSISVSNTPDSSDNVVSPDDDEDTYSGLLNDGVGDADDDDSNDEEEDDPASDPRSTARRPRRTARPLPTWLDNQFKARLVDASDRDQRGVPALYRIHRTFWFPKEDPYFSLLDLNTLTPEKLFHGQFFLWDPAALVSIPCPLCQTALYRHAVIDRPRRCVDLYRTFYIIGYRYRCPSCLHPKSHLNTITFRSWDPRIIQKLPRSLANSFPAMLSYRSGISESVFMFMRSCFQSGMGAKQFSDALRVRHLENYDKLQLSYLSRLSHAKTMQGWLGNKFKSFLPFEDQSSEGYHGFIPSSQWLRDLFDKFMELHAHDFDQAMSLLTALICAIDHSFKLAKHIAKVNGEQVFIALLTVTNEKGEIRVCNLVATKSHSQFELALNRMRESLERYGHDQPAIFYTDNMSDKDFLERCFPSLCDAVVAVEKYSHLEALDIPSDVHVHIMDNVHEIDEAMRSILHDLSDDPRSNELVIFVDSEWNVETSNRGYV